MLSWLWWTALRLILNNLSGKIYISMSLKLVSGNLSCSFIWNSFPYFFIFLDFSCWHPCIRKNSPLFQSWWARVIQKMTLTNQPCHRFWKPLHTFLLVKIDIFVLAAASHLEYSKFFYPSEIHKRKASPSGSPWKS